MEEDVRLMRKLILALAALLGAFCMGLLSGCGYDGSYRYPCQDPTNWESADCKPPICTASGTCPEDIYGSVPQ
jgi:hypothetical protein